MIRPVHEDSRGILSPAQAGERFSLTRFPPSAQVARFVDRYWVVRWDLPDGVVHEQQVLVHPVVNVVLEGGRVGAGGVQRQRFTRALSGAGWVLGTMFRPGGFAPFAGARMAHLTDTSFETTNILGSALPELAVGIVELDPGAAVEVVDRWWATRVPDRPHPCEMTIAAAERAATDPAITRVDQLAAAVGLGERALQQRFAEHVGVSPKWLLRRYRLYEVAERAARDPDLDWAATATELGYSDQSHLVREFTAVVGQPPAGYASTLTGNAS